jgi:hypothetical protein
MADIFGLSKILSCNPQFNEDLGEVRELEVRITNAKRPCENENADVQLSNSERSVG